MAVGQTGDRLERFYTPDHVARAIVQHVLVPMLHRHRIVKPRVLEMHCGGGAFVKWIRKLVPDAYIHGNDIDRDAPGLALCDSRSHVDVARARWSSSWDVNIGNPPWDPDAPAAPTIEHVRRAVDSAPICIQVLPWSYGGQSTWAPLFSPETGFRGIQPINPRPWPNHREAALYRFEPSLRDDELRRDFYLPLVAR